MFFFRRGGGDFTQNGIKILPHFRVSKKIYGICNLKNYISQRIYDKLKTSPKCKSFIKYNPLKKYPLIRREAKVKFDFFKIILFYFFHPRVSAENEMLISLF